MLAMRDMYLVGLNVIISFIYLFNHDAIEKTYIGTII